MKKIAVLTSVRNDTLFLPRWIAHYAACFGAENLFVIMDGQDQPPPPENSGVNVLRLPFVARSRLAGDKARANRASALARALFASYDLVIATDVDEFLAVDPQTSQSLAQYLSGRVINGSLSAMGLDVARNAKTEGPLDPARPFLGQRRFAKISDRYTKALILSKPLQWGSGQHRVRGHKHHIDPSLFLFHFGSVDEGVAGERAADPDRAAAGWGNHQERRHALLDEITQANPLPGDKRFAQARRVLARSRSLVAWNKPRPLDRDAVIEIPERFFGLF